MTERRYAATGAKRVAYLSIEFLLGRILGSALVNIGLLEPWRAAFERLGLTLDQIESHDPEPAVGNGGLGRLAACFLDSLATMGYPAYGYGINYEFGLFQQELDQRLAARASRSLAAGHVSMADRARTEESCMVPLYGRLETSTTPGSLRSAMGRPCRSCWACPPTSLSSATACARVNTLRLYTARRLTSSTWGSSTRRLHQGGRAEGAVRDHLESALSVRQRASTAASCV